MPDVKLQFKLGTLEFVSEGDSAWVAEQLDKVLGKAIELQAVLKPRTGDAGDAGDGSVDGADAPLATFLKVKNVGSNQIQRFLATAIWLTGRGQKDLVTSDVTTALKDNHQPKLNNPSDCLLKNIGKGFCEKKGKGFFVTPDGLKSM